MPTRSSRRSRRRRRREILPPLTSQDDTETERPPDAPPPQDLPAAGWFPDPEAPGRLRWWDGERWTNHRAPVPEAKAGPLRPSAPGRRGAAGPAGPRPERTSGWAITAVVFGVLGVAVVAIVAGLIAKRRIRAAKGALGGDGLASAGIALGCLWTLAAVVLVAFELSGAFDANNAGEYKGQERQIAQVVDRVERAFDDNRGAQACTQLFTPAFARAIAKGGRTTCPRFVNAAVGNGSYQANIDVQSIDVEGDRATVEVKEGGDDEVWRMVRRDGRWLVSAIES